MIYTVITMYRGFSLGYVISQGRYKGIYGSSLENEWTFAQFWMPTIQMALDDAKIEIDLTYRMNIEELGREKEFEAVYGNNKLDAFLKYLKNGGKEND